MLQIWKLFGRFFHKYPFIANSAVYGSLFVGAELSQQLLVKKFSVVKTDNLTRSVDMKAIDKLDKAKGEINYPAIGRYAIMGTLIYAPTLYIWYKWLDRRFPSTSAKLITKKLLLDQFLLTPYLLTVFYIGMSLLENADDIFAELIEKFIPTFQRSCLFWLPVQLMNFILIPPLYRVVYMAVCGFIWVNILFWIKRDHKIAN